MAERERRLPGPEKALEALREQMSDLSESDTVRATQVLREQPGFRVLSAPGLLGAS